MQSNQEQLVMGRITSVYGIKGWVKVYSFAEPMENIFAYTPWKLQLNGQWREVVIDQWKHHGQGLIAHIEGCDDRDIAKHYCEADIHVDLNQLPDLPEGEFYWHQLEGLTVVNTEGVCLGVVDHMLATGANDVLVVSPSSDSVDDQERLIPYLPENNVKEVSLEQRRLVIDWDSSF
ncbi:ribosome maturation factor RimM [Pokkaliibacter sp. CJK22405]|uniref:ribosome maturation factor RimM n=1 Tax=Pokkaliibacter sp. CJK22405 TaxID=3384615 RepID=UPI003984D49D